MLHKLFRCLFCWVALAFAWNTILPCAAFAAEVVGDAMLRDYALYSDLIVRGTITDFGYKKLPPNYFLGSIVDSDGTMRVLEITMTVSETIAGECSDSSLSFLVPEGRIGPIIDGIDTALQKLRIGDSIVAMMSYDLYDLGRYIIKAGPCLLRLEGDKLVAYDEGYSVESEAPLRVLKEGFASRNFDAVSRGAEVMCIATLLSGCVT